MALSGSIYTNVGSHWQLKMTWSATQSISGNYSTVTAKLHWIALDSYGAVDSSATKTCNVTIASNSSNYSAAGMASLSANQDKVIHTLTQQVNHNSDGTGSFNLDGWFDAYVTLGGTTYDRINLTAKTFTLDTIPRASSLTGGSNWTAPNSVTFTIDRASTSFTHTIEIQVSDGSTYHTIDTITGVGTSYTWTPSTSQNTTILDYLNNDTTNWNQSSQIILTTYDGSDNIGSKTYNGTVSSPPANTTTYPSSFNIGDSISGSVSEGNSGTVSTIQLIFGSSTYTLYNQTNPANWTYATSAIASSLYANTPNSNSMGGTLKITTYYNGVQVRNPVSYGITAKVTNSNPTFSTIGYLDTNTTTSGLTGNNQYIIQSKSTVRAQVLAANYAVGVNSATITKYIATLNGSSITKNSPFSGDLNFDFGTVNSSANLTLTITAYDSRGNAKAVTKTVLMVPWSKPVVTTNATRTNGFQDTTTVTLSGTISPLNVNGTNKNALKGASTTYQYAQSGSAYNAATAWPNLVTTLPNYSGDNVVLTLSNLNSWSIQVIVTDQLDSTTVVLTVGTGQPIMFLDGKMKSVGINQFPNANYALSVTGDSLFSGGISPEITGFDGSEDITSYPYGMSVQYNGGASFPSGYGVLFTFNQSVNRNYQLWQTKDTNNLYIRHRTSTGGWSGWDRLLTTANEGSGNGIDADTVDGKQAGNFMWMTNANGYDGLQGPNSGTSNWIRTTTNGLIPYQSGGASSLGTSSWNFNNIYGVNVFKNNNLVLEALSSGHKVQTGTVNLGSLTAGTQKGVGVTFPHAFGSTPVVLLSVQNPEHITGYMNLQTGRTESTTGFTCYGISYADLTYYYVTWIAIGS